MKTGVLLMTYGSPQGDVGEYMTRVRGGRRPSDELIREFERRYEVIGGSPLIPITQAQAAGMEKVLGPDFVVRAGMRFSHPFIAEVVDEEFRGVDRILGLIISPQYSPIIMGGYDRELAAAAEPLGIPARVIQGWHLAPEFIAVLADRVTRALRDLPPGTPVLMTAHSLPKRVVDQEPGFVEQLKDTARAVAMVAGLPQDQWSFAYQSAGHSPEEWLKPDILDVLPKLAREGHKSVLLAPVQFVGDHLETLYDIDVGGREQAEAAGIEQFARVPAPNADPDFCAALAAIVKREVDK